MPWHKPRCTRIFSITAPSSMLAITLDAIHSAVGTSRQFNSRVATVLDRFAPTCETDPDVVPAINSGLPLLLMNLRLVTEVVKEM